MVYEGIFLRDWPDIKDIRPIVKEDVFQNKPLTFTVNANRHKYAGMDKESIERIKKHLQENVPEGKE